MSFKLKSWSLQGRRCLLLILIIFAGSGCTKLFNKTPDLPRPLSPQLDFQQACLSDVTGVMTRFSNSTATPAEVKATWNCFGDGIAVFQKKVNGRSESEFDGREVAQFFERYFLKNIAISDPLLAQIMNIKRIFVGGNSQKVSKDQLKALEQVARQMGDISVQLLPYMKVYTMTWEPDSKADFEENILYFEKAGTTLLSSADALARILTQSGAEYQLENLNPLLGEAQKLFATPWSWLPSLTKVLPFVERLKGLLTGTEAKVIAANEWRQVVVVGFHGYSEFLRYHYFGQSKGPHGTTPIVYFVNSVRGLFSFLSDLVDSKPSKTLTKQELVDLLLSLNDVFPTLHFTENFVDQFMKIKTVVFGGSDSIWTTDDFVQAETKVEIYGSALPKIWAYAKFYGLSWDHNGYNENEAQNYFANAEVNLDEVIKIFASAFASSYDLNNLSDLADALDELIVDPNLKFTWAAQLKSALPLIVGLKEIVLNDESSVVKANQWLPLLTGCSRMYHRYLYYEYFIQGTTIDQGLGLDHLDNFVAQFEGLLTTFVQQQPGYSKSPKSVQVSYAKLEALVASVLPPQIRIASVDSALRAVLGKILVDPNNRLGGYQSTGLSLLNIQNLGSQYQTWSAQQHALNSWFSGLPARKSKSDVLTSILSSAGLPGQLDMMTMISGSPNLVLTDAGNRIFISQNDIGYDRASVSRVNLARAASRAVLAAYIQDLGRYDSGQGINLAEANAAFNDFRPLVVDLGILKESDKGFMGSRFFEAGIFTPTARGANYLSLSELGQEIELILSGLNIQTQSDGFIGDSCTVKKDTNRLNDLLSVPCALGLIADHSIDLFSQLPDAVNYFQSLSRDQYLNLLTQYLRTAGWVDQGGNTAFRSDIGLVTYLVQYAETIMQRYDLNHDGALEYSEAKKAYPNFSNLISTISGTGISQINEAAFYYMLSEEMVPCGFFDLLGDLWPVITHQEIPMKVNRSKMGTILGAIALAEKGQRPNCNSKNSSADGTLNPPPGYVMPVWK